MAHLVVYADADPTLHIIAAAVNAAYRLCLIPPISVCAVAESSVTFRTTQFTREANARIIEALRDTLGSTYTVAWVDRDSLRVSRV